MAKCPCCSRPLLRQIKNHQISWFCRYCWQEMPNWNTGSVLFLSNARSASREICWERSEVYPKVNLRAVSVQQRVR